MRGYRGFDCEGMLIARLHALLLNVRELGGVDFAGAGVMVASDPRGLPIASLRTDCAWSVNDSALETLTAISRAGSRYHDGFHVLSPDLRIVLLSQYLAAPILQGVVLEGSRGGGARYAAALFGSAVPGVLATGVATSTYGVAVFQTGAEIEPDL